MPGRENHLQENYRSHRKSMRILSNVCRCESLASADALCLYMSQQSYLRREDEWKINYGGSQTSEHGCVTTGRVFFEFCFHFYLLIYHFLFCIFLFQAHTYKSMFMLHLLAEFHAMLTSSMMKNYIVLNSTYKRILLISGYILVVHVISMRLR